MAESDITEWLYQGKQLIAVKHPTQTEHYSYDARGLKIAKTVTLQTPQGQHTAVTRYTYDEAGVLQSTSLPDGSRLVYERNGQGQVTALRRELIQTTWLRWAAPAQTLVTHLQRDLIGIKSYTTWKSTRTRQSKSSCCSTRGLPAPFVTDSCRASSVICAWPPLPCNAQPIPCKQPAESPEAG